MAGVSSSEVDIAGHQILHRQSGAAIGHQLPAGPDGVLQEDAGDVAGRADTGIALRRLVGVGLEPRDQLAEVLRRHGSAGDDQERLSRDQRDRLEVLHQIVLERVDGAVRHVGAPLADAERVAVGRRARDTADSDGAAGAGDVLDDHGLAQDLPHAFRHDAADHVGRSARRQRHHHRDRARGIALRVCVRDADKARDQRERQQRSFHGCSPVEFGRAYHAIRAPRSRSACDGRACSGSAAADT